MRKDYKDYIISPCLRKLNFGITVELLNNRHIGSGHFIFIIILWRLSLYKSGDKVDPYNKPNNLFTIIYGIVKVT